MTSLYRQIIYKAWQITKKFAYLWPLGLLVAFLGNSGEYQIIFKEFKKISDQPETVAVWKQNLNLLIQGNYFDSSKTLLLILAMFIVVALGSLFVWLVISSLGGLVKGVAMARNNEKSTLAQLFKTGKKKFWPVLWLNVIAKIIVYGFLTLIIVPLMLATFSPESSINLLIIFLSYLIIVPVIITVSLVTRYAVNYVILANLKFKEAFKNAWRLFSANWLVSLEMAFVLFAINILVTLCFLAISSVLLSLFLFFTLNSPQVFDVPMYIIQSTLLLISAFIGAWLATFQTSSWTLFYLRLIEGGKAYSKIVRWTAKLPGLFKKKSV